MNELRSTGDEGEIPISVKMRIESGCFHREHSPEAYRLIDCDLARSSAEAESFHWEEHETGPEILTWIIGGVGLPKGIVDLVLLIVKARAEGIQKGDSATSPVEIVIRGFHKDGEYFEEKVIRIPHDHPLVEKTIQDALRKYRLPLAETKKRKKGTKRG